MKILLNYLYKEASGPVFTLEMARGFAENECEVYAVLSSKIANRADWEKEKSLNGICFIETGTRKTAIRATAAFLLYKHREVKKYFQGIEFDYIVQTFYHPWAEFVNQQVRHKKIVTLCHDPVLHSGVSKREIWATKRFVRNSDEVVVLTKSFIPIVEENYGFPKDHIHYMPHGRMGDYKEKQVSTYEPIYSDNKVNFLFFGRISEYKGLHGLARAFGKLQETHDDVTLTVAGSGDFSEYEPEFSNLSNVRVDNRYIDDNEVGKYFDSRSVVLVLPYLDATQSGVTPIALEYGVPIIASDTGGLREQLDDGKIGLFAEAGNVDDLYHKMLYIVENRDEMKQQREKMRTFLKSLEWSSVVKTLLLSLNGDR